MVLIIVAFCAVFLLIASGGLILFYREALPQRIAEAINPRPKTEKPFNTIQRDGLFARRRGGAFRASAAEEPG